MKLSLYYPVSPARLAQGFGVNGAYYRANGINIIGHNGLDLQAYHGQPIYAAMDGYAFYEVDDKSGHGVVIVSDDQYDAPDAGACNYKTTYWHLCNPVTEPQYASPIWSALGNVVNTGKSVHVKTGQLIGFADNTGLSTGDHLHFGLKPIRTGKPLPDAPEDAADDNIGNWQNVLDGNGYFGAVDPTPFFNGFFAADADKVITIYQKLAAVLRQYLFQLQHAGQPADAGSTPFHGTPPSSPTPQPTPAPTVPATVPESAPDRLTTFCTAIRDNEGQPGDLNYRNNNPGNFRCSPVGYAGKYGNVRCINNFAVFPSYELGWEYLTASVSERIEQHPTWTFYDFFANYAPAADNNSPAKYAEYVAQRCGVPPATCLSTFINTPAVAGNDNAVSSVA